MIKKLKSEKGGIALFVVVAILFIMAILIAVYWNANNHLISVLQDEERIKEIYGKDLANINSIYDEITGQSSSESSIIIKPGDKAIGGNKQYLGIVVPEGFTLSKIPGEYENADNGIVIYDIPEGVDTSAANFWTETVTTNGITCPKVQTMYNQFVWVPAPTAYVTAGEITNIINNNDLSSYAGDTDNQKAINYIVNNQNKYPMAVKLSNGNYRGIAYNFTAGTNGVDITARDFSIDPIESYETKWKTLDNSGDTTVYKTYYRESGMVSSDFGIAWDIEELKFYALSTPVNTIGITLNSLEIEYNKMVDSVQENKGFYIARYELGYNGNTSKGESKRAQAVSTSDNSNTYRWYGLYATCQGMYNSNADKVQSMMISGSQYDQTMIWMKNIKNKEDNSKYYVLDSTGMGIYKVGDTNGTSRSSGRSDNYRTNQIYDLGGNFFEWTSEAYQTTHRTLRGGAFNKEGSAMPVSSRYFTYPNSHDASCTR